MKQKIYNNPNNRLLHQPSLRYILRLDLTLFLIFGLLLSSLFSILLLLFSTLGRQPETLPSTLHYLLSSSSLKDSWPQGSFVSLSTITMSPQSKQKKSVLGGFFFRILTQSDLNFRQIKWNQVLHLSHKTQSISSSLNLHCQPGGIVQLCHRCRRLLLSKQDLDSPLLHQ